MGLTRYVAFGTLNNPPDLLEFDIGPNAEFHRSAVTSVPLLYFLYFQMCINALADSAISQLHALYFKMKLKVLENK